MLEFLVIRLSLLILLGLAGGQGGQEILPAKPGSNKLYHAANE